MTLLEEVPSRILREIGYPRPRDRAPRPARAPSRGRQSDRPPGERPPDCRKHDAHSTPLPGDGRNILHREVNKKDGEFAWLITLHDEPIGACGLAQLDGPAPDLGYWLGAPYWGNGYATEAARAVIDHAFAELGHEVLQAGARVTNPASRRVLEKCGFQWTGVGLYRIRALKSSAPIDRFRLDRGIWASLKSWGKAKLSL